MMPTTSASDTSIRSSTSFCLIAASSRRIVDRRAASLARMAAFMSSVIVALSVIGLRNAKGRIASPLRCGSPARSIKFGRQLLTAQALVMALDCSGELALALGGGLFVELAGAELGQETCLLDRALEAAQCHLEGLIFADADTGHWRIDPFATPTLEITLTYKS